jgi:hypothetical protein
MNAQPASPRTWMLALVLGGLIASGAHASPTPVYYYSTTGDVGGLTTGPITFTGNNSSGPSSNGTALPGAIDLGQFQSQPLPPGATLTLNETPFTINLKQWAAPSPGEPITNAPDETISGVLNGSINGNNATTLMAQITSVKQVQPGPVPLDLSSLTTASPVLINPSGIGNGISGFAASVPTSIPTSFFNIPEPTTLAMFATALVGLGFRRRLRIGH